MIHARLIGCTEPQIEGVDTAEALLAFTARVSSTANQHKHETGAKLIRYLIANKEWSPLEMIHCLVEVETTRDIGRQIIRHPSFRFQEFSQRYAMVTNTLRKWITRARLQDTKNRQNSIVLDYDRDDHQAIEEEWLKLQEGVIECAYASYERGLTIGVAKELARKVLPEGLTPTRMYMSGSLRSFIHYCALRADAKTQLEHRLVARNVWQNAIAQKFPTLAQLAFEGVDLGDTSYNPYVEQ